jgi:hypothetical protein
MSNFWQHTQPIPAAFYDGTTGIEPVDTVIHNLSKHPQILVKPQPVSRIRLSGRFERFSSNTLSSIDQTFSKEFEDE